MTKEEFKEKMKEYFYGTLGLPPELTESDSEKFLQDYNLIKNELQLNEDVISEMVKLISSEEVKKEMMSKYKLSLYKEKIISTFSEESKLDIALNEDIRNSLGIEEYEMLKIVESLSIESLKKLFNENRTVLEELGIKPYSIVRDLTPEKQLEFIGELENFGLTLDEKRQILATLSEEVKEQIDTSNYSKDYITALRMKISDNGRSYGKIVPDLTSKDDLERYKGLDELLGVNAVNLDEEQRSNLMQLIVLCPEMNISDYLGITSSTGQEYINGEAWIEKVIQGINQDWTNIQKIAYVDHAIGRRISYSPDAQTEVSDESKIRSLWKIIDTGYGVCNGIAQIEKYILDRLGIESEQVSGEDHSFLKLKNVEISNSDGTTKRGDTILDPTWNLTAQRYGGLPSNFCINYSTAREHDIGRNGKDFECHKNDEKLSSATLELDEESIREIYKSIGLTDKDGIFPLQKLAEECREIDSHKYSEHIAIRKLFDALREYEPNFINCPNSTMSVLRNIVFKQPNFRFNRCVAKRVYERSDKSRKPVMYVYADIPDTGEYFYYADSNENDFISIPKSEFEKKFECYDYDLRESKGIRPWEEKRQQSISDDLSKSSGNVATKENEER